MAVVLDNKWTNPDLDGRLLNKSTMVLGSYVLSAKVSAKDADGSRARVVFTVTDAMRRESGMRNPTSEGYKSGKANGGLKSVFDKAQRLFREGQKPMKMTVQWSEWVDVR